MAEIDKLQIPGLNDLTHRNPEIHMIGDSLPNPTVISALDGTSPGLGTSPVAAREDHEHDLSGTNINLKPTNQLQLNGREAMCCMYTNYVPSNGNLVCGGARAVVPNLSLTLALLAGDVLIVEGCLDVTCTALGGAFIGEFYISSVPLAYVEQIVFAPSAVNERVHQTKRWRYVVPANANVTFGVYGYLTGGGYTVINPHSTMSVEVFSSN